LSANATIVGSGNCNIRSSLTSKIQQTGVIKMTFLKMAGATALLTLLPVTTMAQTAPSAGECDAWFAKAATTMLIHHD
jgi:hypothetical protein